MRVFFDPSIVNQFGAEANVDRAIEDREEIISAYSGIQEDLRATLAAAGIQEESFAMTRIEASYLSLMTFTASRLSLADSCFHPLPWCR